MTNKIEQAQAAIAAMDDVKKVFDSIGIDGDEYDEAAIKFDAAADAAFYACIQALRSLRVAGWQYQNAQGWIDAPEGTCQFVQGATGCAVRPIYAEELT